MAMLTVMAERRQASYSDATLEVYVADLYAYDLRDVQAACDAIGKRSRAEGEPAFPDIGALLEEVKRHRRDRSDRERRAAEQHQREQEARRMRENPEEFVSVAEIFREAVEKIGARGHGQLRQAERLAAPEDDPATMLCPHCRGVLPFSNLTAGHELTVDELRTIGNGMLRLAESRAEREAVAA